MIDTRIQRAGIADIAGKAAAGERLSLEDGARLFECPDLLAVGHLANQERERRHGKLTYYNFNIRLEATNVCVASCLFCSFARLTPDSPAAYTLSLEQVFDKLRQRAHQPLTEVHVVNGLLTPTCRRSFWNESIRRWNWSPGIRG
jgi:aminodeoxyfutalosine synthase